MKIPEVMPHRLVDNIADGLVGAVDGLGNSVVGAVRGAGKTVMGAFDKPFSMIAGDREGPHRIADRLADTAIDSVTNLASTGFIGSIKRVGKGIMSALDHPLDQIKK